jgi:signal transduction histidine kinase
MLQPLIPVALVAAAWLSGLFIHLLWPNRTWVNLTFHSTLETLGGFAAVLMALVLSTRKEERNEGQIRWIAKGFFGMGLLEILHATSPPGDGFILLRSAASLLGGLGFALAWVSTETAQRQRWNLILLTVVASTAALALWTLGFPDSVPRMAVDGVFTPGAAAINSLAALLFLIGAVACWRDYRRSKRAESYLLASLALLFAAAEIMFLASAPWDAEWWVWHLVRFAAYAWVLIYVDRKFVLTVADLRSALARTRQSERRLVAEYAVTRILAESATIQDTVHGVLRVVGESLDWQVGMFWEMDRQKQVLRFVDLWHAPQMDATEFIEDSKERTFQRGEGLVGRVWDTAKPIWIPDVCADPTFRRSEMAARVGLHAALAFPVAKGEQLYGVIDCFSRTSREPDPNMLEMLADLGIKVGLFVDRKRTEEELRQTEARLVQEQRLAEVARVLGDIGHDLKNLLMPISTGAGLLEEELNDCFSKLPQPAATTIKPTRDHFHELIDIIRQSSRRINDRVKEIADSVKGLTRPPQFAPCRLADIVANVYKTLRVLADERHVALRTEGLDTLPVIRADESRLFNALYNLVNNAIPEVPEGGSVTVQGRVDESGKHILLSVIDTGRGMSQEVRDSLFSYQAISRKVGGTGLGTKIVKDVVDAHGGTIRVESSEGKGTAFHITLSIDGPSPQPASNSQS